MSWGEGRRRLRGVGGGEHSQSSIIATAISIMRTWWYPRNGKNPANVSLSSIHQRPSRRASTYDTTPPGNSASSPSCLHPPTRLFTRVSFPRHPLGRAGTGLRGCARGATGCLGARKALGVRGRRARCLLRDARGWSGRVGSATRRQCRFAPAASGPPGVGDGEVWCWWWGVGSVSLTLNGVSSGYVKLFACARKEIVYEVNGRNRIGDTEKEIWYPSSSLAWREEGREGQRAQADNRGGTQPPARSPWGQRRSLALVQADRESTRK